MKSADWLSKLGNLDESTWPAILDANSGLPSPRANLELLAAFALRASDTLARRLADSPDEYRAACAAAALARRADSTDGETRARSMAADQRWRVRMGVEIGLQLLGDANLSSMQAIARKWSTDSSPLVQRTAVAAVCEPRLLQTPEAAEVAIAICQTTTENLRALSEARRREPEARTLRQALGYCWSVAVAAAPKPGLTAFRSLDDSDPDIAWIIKQNLSKKRLSTLL